MTAAFNDAEYKGRLVRVRDAMSARELDTLIVGDPANINWLCGYDAWSFYTPQIMVVSLTRDLIWMGREMDAGAASFTSCLTPEQLVPFPEHLVQRDDAHPAGHMGDWLAANGYAGDRIGFESDVYFLSPKALQTLQSRLCNATWVDADLLINWVRVTKSPAEIDRLREAATIAGVAMNTAYEGVRPGVRQCDLMAEVVAAQIRGTPEFGGDSTALHPLVLAGEAAATAHPMWTDARFEPDQTVAFELGGCRKRYNAGLARTVHLGSPPNKLLETERAVREGLDRVLETLRAGVRCDTVHAAWQRVLDRYGLQKKSRIGYSIGVGYAPDWGEHTLSLRADEPTEIPAGAVIHVMLGMWLDGWGMEISETVHVRDNDCECLTSFPRAVQRID